MATNPITQFNRWLEQARKAKAPLPESVALATTDSRGRPTVRFVLLKKTDKKGFVFYTNAQSPKGRDLARNPHAALAVYWDVTGHQVRVDGKVSRIGDEEADEYWVTRPRASQVAAVVSRQSARLASLAKLDADYRRAMERFRARAVPRPPQWTGYRLEPRRIEFWVRREPRLHLRELYEHKRGGWEKTLLQP